MTRKIVQITASESAEGGRTFYALCDDGTLWCTVSGSKDWLRWEQLPEIPQPPPPPARNPFNLPEAVLRGAIPG